MPFGLFGLTLLRVGFRLQYSEAFATGLSFMPSLENQPPAELISMLESYPEPAVLLSSGYLILATNGAYRRTYGESSASQRHCYEVSHHYDKPCDLMGESCPMKRCQETGQAQRVFHLHHTCHGEEHVDVELYPVHSASGDAEYFLEVMRHSKLASPRPGGVPLVGRSACFARMIGLIERAAPSETTVLLLGESGTGKELVAQAVHKGSQRSQGPFVPVECSGLTETLFESELFGHEKGAFTGANSRKIGLVESAAGGTLFLDEIGDIPLPQQVKLLRLLETGTFRRVGGVETLKADFRLVCATHQNLDQQVADGDFRMDLYYRINAFPVDLPALQERTDDLPLLIDSILPQFAGERHLTVSPEALRCLQSYNFPGNVRELRNILERACLLADDQLIEPEHLPARCLQGAQHSSDPHEAQTQLQQMAVLKPMSLYQVEKHYLEWVWRQLDGDKKKLAQLLDVSERTLYRKLKEYDVS